MWHSMLYRQVPLVSSQPKQPWRSAIKVGTKTRLSDLSIDSNALTRTIGQPGGSDYGIQAIGESWLIQRVWVQHCDAQWLSGTNGVIRDCRVADSWGDGINLNNGNRPDPEKPGINLVGGSYSPWNGFRQFGKIEKTSGSYGFYAHADQMVYHEAPGSEQGLTLFAASGYYPQDNISIIPWQLNLGAFYTGLIPGRERDKTIVGLIYGRFGDDYADTVDPTGRNRPTRETVLEIAHRIQLSKFAYIQPDAQFVSRPGGTGAIDDAVVIGAQFGISL
jgi:hypothetical protein